MAPILYTLFVGIPLGVTLIAMGVKALSYPQPTRYEIRLRVAERR